MKHKSILFTYFGSAAFALVLRCLQILFLTDPSTGFEMGTAPKVYLSYLCFFLLGGVAIAIYITSGFLSKRQPICRPRVKKSPLLPFSAFLAGACCIITGVKPLFEGREAATQAGGLIPIILGLLAGLFFFFYGAKKWISFRLPAFLTVLPIAFIIYRLVISFIDYTGVAAISENIFDIFGLLFALLFFLLQGKILSSIEVRKSSRQIFPVGLLTALMAAVYALPPILLSVLGMGAALHTPLSFYHILSLSLGLYALCFTLNLYKAPEDMPPRVRSVDDLKIDPPESKTDFLSESEE